MTIAPSATATSRDGLLPLLVGLWGAGAFAASALGFTSAIARVSAPAYGLVIAATIALPVALYLAWPPLARRLDAIPLRSLTLFHVPRVAGGVLFLVYGWLGLLPPVFAILLGFGDIIAAAAAAAVLPDDASPTAMRLGHLTGLADFAIGLTCGMTLGLLGDTRLVPIAELPLSQIVLWWVGMLATTHVVALVRLGRGERA